MNTTLNSSRETANNKFFDNCEVIDIEREAKTFQVHGKQHKNLYNVVRDPRAMEDYCAQIRSGKDVVTIYKEDIEKLSSFGQKGILEKGSPVALPHFVLKITGFEKSAPVTYLEAVYDYEDKELLVHFFADGHLLSEAGFAWNETEEGWLKTIEENRLYYTAQPTEEGAYISAGNTAKLATLFSIVNYYLSYYEGGMAIEEKWAKKQSPSSSGKKKKKGQSQVRLVKHYTLKREWKKVHKRHKHPITCSAWGVRGHMRHYASGKVIFIKAYVKGKDRDNYKGKEYKIS